MTDVNICNTETSTSVLREECFRPLKGNKLGLSNKHLIPAWLVAKTDPPLQETQRDRKMKGGEKKWNHRRGADGANMQ